MKKKDENKNNNYVDINYINTIALVELLDHFSKLVTKSLKNN